MTDHAVQQSKEIPVNVKNGDIITVQYTHPLYGETTEDVRVIQADKSKAVCTSAAGRKFIMSEAQYERFATVVTPKPTLKSMLLGAG